ncbi:hypothetical protein LUZ63_009413 [Rhynchospora breviuscula]|uniref:RING-type domain-containing protein n=1 Tax=Rhynchospora breviuscula TaxID=2022672 RepID=A0A9Q0HP36_9POAL|nr:hypothetical protein LUZ63_009413 [Rhynchospora breviuscula]
MGGSSLLGFVQKKYSVVDRAIAEALQNQEIMLNNSSDEEIARQLQEMENLFINAVPDEESHFSKPTTVLVQTPRGSPNRNDGHEGWENHDDDHENDGPRGHEHVDPDNMTYEELQQLGEDIGTESKGLSEKTIASLRVSKYKDGFFSKAKKQNECPICQSAFQKKELLITLPCKHIFHKNCITPWLKMNKVCPMCKYEIAEKK